jgi:hypothetical protein
MSHAHLHAGLLRSGALAAAILLAAPLTALATPAVTVTGQGVKSQIVFAFPSHVGFGFHRDGNTLSLRFTGGGVIPPSGGGASSVTVRGGANQATVDIPPGAEVHTMRRGNRIILTVTGAAEPPAAATPPVSPAIAAVPPPPAPPPTPATQPATQPVQPPAQATVQAPVQATVQAPMPPPAALPVQAPAAPAAPATGPQPLMSADLSPGPPSGTDAVTLPFAARVGAAAFRRGKTAWIVFDDRHPIDPDDIEDSPLLAHATVQLLTAATLLRLPIDPSREIQMKHVADGWEISTVPAAPPAVAIAVVTKPLAFELPVAEASQVVAVPDPETGTNLLVGTLRGAGAGIAVARLVPAFALQPTWRGVLVEPVADTTTLRATATGFVLEAAGEALSPGPDSASTLADAAYLTRRFEIPTGPPDMLMRRLQSQEQQAGEAPAQSRGKPRKAAAASLIALGLGVEAQAMINLATEEDPRLIADPDIAGLAAIAAMLGGRDNEAGGIDDPALTGTDEVAFWRAFHTAQAHPGDPGAAAVFASTVKLVLAYPQPLRHALLPLVAETMALGGATAAADDLLARLKDDPTLAFARAIRLEAKGSNAEALAAYDTIANGRDRLDAARAATRATLLRLTTNAITPGQAADQLEAQFLNWRGDGRELDLRMRVATLRTQAGAWRAAFALLRETEALYPDSAPMIEARMADLMTTLLTGPAAAALSPLELITLTEENAELVATVAPAKVAALMADKLLALDLPNRAGPVIERMMHAAPIGVGQATLGVRLAALRLGEGDDAGAQTALADSNAPGLPPDLIERRSLILARLAAHAGHTARAAAILSAIGTPAADEMRAAILTDAQDWQGVAGAIADLAAKLVPVDGPLSPPQQDIVLRLASALSRAGDDAGLRALAVHQDGRMDGPRLGTFRLLTAAPVTKVSDLPRASTELSLVKAIPGGLSAIGTR